MYLYISKDTSAFATNLANRADHYDKLVYLKLVNDRVLSAEWTLEGK